VTLAVERMMGVFFEKRRTPFVVLAFSLLLCFAVTSLAFLFLRMPAVNMFASLATMFIITLNYESTIRKRLVATFGTFIFMAVADLLLGLSFGAYQHGVFDIFEVDNTFAFIAIGTINYIFALFLRRFKNIKKSAMNSTVFLLFYLIILIFTIIFLMFFVATYLPLGAAFVTTIVLLGVNVFIFYLYNFLSAAYEDKLKSALHTQEKEYYFTQCQLMQDSVERVKAIRHDMKLHLATAADYNAGGKVNELAEYLRGLLGDISASEVYSDTGNIAFDSIINFKLRTAAEQNIKTDMDVLIPQNLTIEVADIVTLLGNLLDNALDAVAQTPDKRIKLNVKANKGNLFIKVDNTFDGEVKYAKGKDGIAEAIITRKSGDNHGYGLKNIRKVAEKYHGHVEISHDGNVFSVGVLLYVGGM